MTETISSSASETEVNTTVSSQDQLIPAWNQAKSQSLKELLNDTNEGTYTSVLDTVRVQVETNSLTFVQEQGQELDEEVEILDAYDYQEPGHENRQRYFFIRKADGSSQILVSSENQDSTYHTKVVSDSELISLFEEILKK